MILQSLANYYIRKSRSPRSGENVAPYGMEYKEIKFLIEIDEEGNFVNLTDLRGGDRRGKTLLVPKAAGRSGYRPFFFNFSIRVVRLIPRSSAA